MNISGLYLITAESGGGSRDELIVRVERAIQGGAQLIQYRDKGQDLLARYHIASRLKVLCDQHRLPLIINDDVRLADDVNANGVHLGREDMPLAEARQWLGPEAIIGISCYNDLDLARQSAAQGADYVALGRFFPSPTKPDAVIAPLATLRRARKQLNIPVVAIGGITPDNGASLLDAGADALAVISGVFSQTDTLAAARHYARLFTGHAGRNPTE